MLLNLLKILRCPKSGEKFKIEIKEKSQNRVKEGKLTSLSGSHTYEIRNYIPRFVNEENYTNNFGYQWNKFAKTQLDSFSGKKISINRFEKSTNWHDKNLKEKLVLDVGCGSGRFTEVALKKGFQVIAIDYSNSVEACMNNFLDNDNLNVIQANIYELPFKNECFDFIFSLGVLQHTPDVKKAFITLFKYLKMNSNICIDFYEKKFYTFLLPKHFFRIFTKRIEKEKLFKIINFLTPYILKMNKILIKIPFIGKYLIKISPIADYSYDYDLSDNQLTEWAILDTFDRLSAYYDNPQSKKDILAFLNDLKIKKYEIIRNGHLIFRAIK